MSARTAAASSLSHPAVTRARERDEPLGPRPLAPDAATYRTSWVHFATAVVIVTAIDEGEPVGMACNSFSSVSVDRRWCVFCAASRPAPGRACGRRASGRQTSSTEDAETVCACSRRRRRPVRPISFGPGRTGSRSRRLARVRPTARRSPSTMRRSHHRGRQVVELGTSTRASRCSSTGAGTGGSRSDGRTVAGLVNDASLALAARIVLAAVLATSGDAKVRSRVAALERGRYDRRWGASSASVRADDRALLRRPSTWGGPLVAWWSPVPGVVRLVLIDSFTSCWYARRLGHVPCMCFGVSSSTRRRAGGDRAQRRARRARGARDRRRGRGDAVATIAGRGVRVIAPSRVAPRTSYFRRIRSITIAPKCTPVVAATTPRPPRGGQDRPSPPSR